MPELSFKLLAEAACCVQTASIKPVDLINRDGNGPDAPGVGIVTG
jgi:hypothetical protein